MASLFHIQKPFVLTTLSSPLARPDGPGQYSVGEVFGHQPGGKKRKRSELSVGIDGDAVNLYDVSSANLITSYPIPPQSTFTCPPCSLRWRSPTSKNVVRYTYVSTQDALASKGRIMLFKDVLAASGNTTSSSFSHTHRYNTPIIHLSSIALTEFSSTSLYEDQADLDIVAVARDGSIVCLHGETLKEKWCTSPSSLLQGLPSSTSSEIQVEFAQTGSAADVMHGIFGGKSDVLTTFSQKVETNGLNPDVLLLVTAAPQPEPRPPQRYLQILAMSQGNKNRKPLLQGMNTIFTSPLPSRDAIVDTPSQYCLDIKSGSLQELSGGKLYSYALNGGTVRLEHRMEVSSATSFVRLSRASVLASTPTSLDVYNPTYRSLQTTTPLDTSETAQTQPRPYQEADPCSLVTYFGSRDIAVGVRGKALIAVQLESPRTRGLKRRAEGLLIDSLGRGISHEHNTPKRIKEEHASSVFSQQLPGSASDTYWAQLHEQTAKADTLFASGDLDAFERLLADRFGMELAEDDAMTNGADAPGSQELPEWVWPSSRDEYPLVDRRWILYAINKTFSVHKDNQANGERPLLACQLAEGNVVNYLVDAGHLTIANFKSAFKDEFRNVDDADMVLAEQLPELLSDIDTPMELLAGYLAATELGPAELVSAIRIIMRSLDLVQDPSFASQGLLTDGQSVPDENDIIGMELDRAEEELKRTEYYCNDASTRATGLSVAFNKLGACAAPATVKCIRRLLSPDETLSLINVLRMELVKDGWTTRYLDASHPDTEDEGEGPPDGSIQLIADLLCKCLDAVGSGGWLANGALLASLSTQPDSVEFLQQFKAEVSVALEGIEEAVRLRGILTEAVKYGASVQKALVQSKALATTVVPPLDLLPAQSRMLPLGLKANPRVSLEKVVSGGEVMQRSKREVGALIGKTVGPYVIERVGPRE